jgi:hypothetical protein
MEVLMMAMKGGVLEGFGRAALIGLSWAAGWLLPSLIGGSIWHGEVEPQHIGGALAGFPTGMLFAFIAGIAAGRRTLADLSIMRAAACGAIAGAIIGTLPTLIGSQHAPGDRPLWVLPVVIVASLSVVCAISAALSVLVARWVRRQTGSIET